MMHGRRTAGCRSAVRLGVRPCPWAWSGSRWAVRGLDREDGPPARPLVIGLRWNGQARWRASGCSPATAWVSGRQLAARAAANDTVTPGGSSHDATMHDGSSSAIWLDTAQVQRGGGSADRAARRSASRQAETELRHRSNGAAGLRGADAVGHRPPPGGLREELEAAVQRPPWPRPQVEEARPRWRSSMSPATAGRCRKCQQSAARLRCTRRWMDACSRGCSPARPPVATGARCSRSATPRAQMVARLLTADALRAVPGTPVRIERWGRRRCSKGACALVQPPSPGLGAGRGGAARARADRSGQPGAAAGPRWAAARVGVRIVTRSLPKVLKVPVSAVFPRPEGRRCGVRGRRRTGARLVPRVAPRSV